MENCLKQHQIGGRKHYNQVSIIIDMFVVISIVSIASIFMTS